MSASVESLLAEVEARLRARPEGLFDFTHEVVQSLIGAGGKRLRPRMVVSIGLELGLDPANLVEYAVAVEMVHNGTLLQDDVIDRSPTRRGRPTAWSLWGEGAGILGGDYLFMYAIGEMLKQQRVQPAQWMSETIQTLVEGEMLQQQIRWNADAAERDILAVSERKTGALFAWICRVLADDAGLDGDVAARWGRLLGLGFQTADDLLDFHRQSMTGKPVNKDLREGMLTLPIRRAMSGNAALTEAVTEAFVQRSDAAFDRAYAALAATGVVEDVRQQLEIIRQELLTLAPQWLTSTKAATELIDLCLFRMA